MTFSFHHLKVDYKNGDKWSLMAPDIHKLKEIFASWQEGMAAGGGWNAVFWCNHDQPRIVSRLGDTGKYWKESAKMLAAAIHLMRRMPTSRTSPTTATSRASTTTASCARRGCRRRRR